MAYPIPERDGTLFDDPCGCFEKSYLGYDDMVTGTGLAAGTGLTGNFANKPRKGASGGGNAGNKTSLWSKLVHKHNIKHGKSPKSRNVRNLGRKIITKYIPGVGAVQLIFDSAMYSKCMLECDKKKQCQL